MSANASMGTSLSVRGATIRELRPEGRKAPSPRLGARVHAKGAVRPTKRAGRVSLQRFST